MLTPRPYQQITFDNILKSFEDFTKLLAVIPTGGGKTLLFSWLAKHFADMGKRTLILAHREELVDQAIDKLHSATGIRAEKEKAEFEATLSAPVVVASIQTMGRRLDKWPRDHFDLVVPDEAHHVLAPSWLSVLSHFDGHANVLGVTATPDRSDKKNLGQYFESVATEISLFDLINDGYLSRITVKSIPLEIDLKKVTQTAGDFDSKDLDDALTPYLHSIAVAIRDHASFRRTLVFVPLIKTSLAFVEACRAVGLNARHIDGESDNRKEILADFAAGRFDMLSNAMLLTEGFDDPGIECVIILRPTKSRSLYSQMVGRGTRVDSAKENLLLLDFLWMHERHNLIRPAHLVASTDEEAEVITKLAQAGGGELDIEELATEATDQRHAKLRDELERNRKKKGKLVDAMEFCLQMGDATILDYEPVMKWERDAVTPKQAKFLKRNKIDVETVSGKGQAKKLIDLIYRNQKLTLASEKQRGLMRRMGCVNWETATAVEARQFMAGLRNKEVA